MIVAHDRDGTDPRFTDADLRLAETFAPRAAVAVDLSARVAGDALRRVVEAQELERRRLARELHDQTGQELTSVLLGLKAVEEARSDEERAEALAAVREQVVETLHDVRRLAVELRPKALDDFGLVAALEHLRDTFSEQTGMRVDLEANVGDRLPSDVETALYRIVQEALTNIVKHAQARAVSIVLARSGRAITAVIEDDGRGFTPGGGGRARAARHGRAARAPWRQAEARVEPRRRHDDRGRGAAAMSENEMIRVLIVDDHAVVRSGLRKVLESEPDIEVVGEAGDAKNAVFQTRATKPDVILMDVVMPGKTGIEAIPDVLHDAPEAKVLILSMQDDPRYVREAFDAGASGYVLKEAVDTDVVAAIRDVAGGGRYVHPALGARMVAADAEERKRAEEDPLSDRERDVLRLLALGHTNQEIASQLYISVRTAETHRAHIMQKLRLRPVRSSSATRSSRACSRRTAPSRALHVLRRSPGLGPHPELRAPDADARIDCDAAVREREHRVEVELGNGRDVLAQACEAQKQIGERRAVRGRGAAKAAHEPPGLAAVDELFCVAVGERRDPEIGFADQLGEDATGAEGDQRPEDRVLHDAGQELGAADDHRLDDQRPADPLGRGSHGVGVREIEGDAAELGLVRARELPS